MNKAKTKKSLAQQCPFNVKFEAYHDGSGIFCEATITHKYTVLGDRFTISVTTKGYEDESEVTKIELELLMNAYTVVI